jgi:hypothetical protein
MAPLLRAALLLALCAIVGCAGPARREAGTPPVSLPPLATLMPTPTAAPASSAPPAGQPIAPVDTGWQPAAPGVELRRLPAPGPGGGQISVSAVRLDPALVRLQVGYAPDEPRALGVWAAEAGAVAAINGSFFDERGRSVALLVSGGQPSGESYVGRGGQLGVSPDGAVRLRALSDEPYDPAEPLAEALQGWPMLVKPGGVAAYSFEDGDRARRSVVAVDRDGRVLLIAVAAPALTLRELSEWLAACDLAIDAAVNLDGGSSTGLILQGDGAREQIQSFVPLPIVLLALPR